ncbi:hypothetical protein HAX54_046535 [Datura stramonium]|uniref:Uncharacterized protein n=1 Tax=Datura stramonium TaxID=4076 RepID=A0ABS8WLZ9_DATST|nr:hypothetical protein [Datura stramonium]
MATLFQFLIYLFSYSVKDGFHNFGTFQRDFEGGVSAENLEVQDLAGMVHFYLLISAPSWSHPTTPPEANNNNRQISPNNLLPEGLVERFPHLEENYDKGQIVMILRTLEEEGRNEEEKDDDLCNDGQTQDGNAPNVDAASPLKQSSRQKSSSNNEDGMKLPPEKEHFAFRDAMKRKGNQCHNAQNTEVIKEGSVADPFIASEEKANGRKTEKLLASTEYPGLASNGAPHAVCESNPAAPQGRRILWTKKIGVCCDQVSDLAEEETTKALRALYQVPMNGATAPASDEHQDHQKAGIPAIDAGGKKIYGSKGVSSVTKQEGSLSSNGVRRNHLGTPNSRSSNGTANSPTDENGHQLVGLSSSSIIEEQRR